MNEPQSIEYLLRRVRDAGAVDDNNGAEDWSLSDGAIDEAKAAIEAMVRDILGNYDGNDLVLRSNLRQQRLRASKYNLKLEKE